MDFARSELFESIIILWGNASADNAANKMQALYVMEPINSRNKAIAKGCLSLMEHFSREQTRWWQTEDMAEKRSIYGALMIYSGLLKDALLTYSRAIPDIFWRPVIEESVANAMVYGFR